MEKRGWKMRIAVFGSTGGTGISLLQQAVQRGHRVVAFARDTQKISSASPHLEVYQGDVLDAEAVSLAVNGADAVISVLGVRLGQTPGTVRSQGTRHIVNALHAAGVKRFISVSSVGAGDSRDRLSLAARFLLPRIIGSQRLSEAERQEDIIRAADLEWTVLRPARLVDGAGTGRYRIGTALHTGMGSRVTRSDLASALLDELERKAFLHACPTVVN